MTSVHWVETYSAYVAGVLYLLVGLFIAANAISAKLVGVSTAASDEVSLYAVSVAVAWSMAYALRTGAHVRVDVVLRMTPKAVQGYLNVFALFVLCFFVTLLVWRSWALALNSLAQEARANTPYHTPLAWIQIPWAIGYSFFLLVSLVMLLEGIYHVARGRAAQLADRLDEHSEGM